MSTTIDQKVVEMQFNNSNFESNVKTSMNTLEKLKNALNFSGSTKGLEDLNSAVNNVNMSGLGSAVQTVQEKFSALEVVAISALATITNQAVQAGEQLIAALTVDNIAAGWEKFAQKTTSVGTLISQGYDIDTVTEQLERLNWYTDETSYNFTDMVSNIAKFTASGQDLETSVTAMEGIANWAALSGQNATTASTAMYQLAQAMSAGYMRLEDYKSIQNASMDTEEFRQKCIDAAVALGTLQENADGTYTSIVDGATSCTFTLSSFTTGLTKGAWLTSDVMMDVFNNYSNAVDQIYEYAEEKGITASEAIEELGDTVDEFGLKAFKAAQEARTWADVVDSVKDAASTAWMNIFELFIGNYEQATSLYTSMANTLYDIFIEPLNSLYDTLEGALSNNPFTELAEKIQNVTSPVTDLADEIDSLTKSAEDYASVVDSIIKGDWGNGQTRWDALTEAGYDWAYAQNLVNEKLGDATRHATDYTEATEELTDAQSELSETITPTIEDLTKMSEAELETLGFTEDEVSALQELTKAAEQTGIPIEDLVEDISQLNGRTLLLNGLKNVCESLMSVFSAVGEAWSNVFPAATSEQIYNAIAAFHKFTTYLEMSEEQLDKVTRTFEGFFSVLKLIETLIGSGINAAFKVFKSVLNECNIGILDATSSVGDALKNFTEWANQNDRLTKGIDAVADVLISGVKVIKQYANAFMQLEIVQTVIRWFKDLLDTLYDWGITNDGIVDSLQWLGETLIDGAKAIKEYFDAFVQLPAVQSMIETFSEKLQGLKEIGENAIAGLAEGFQNGTLTMAEILTTIGKAIIQAIKDVLGIHSPSTEMYDVASNAVEGLKNGFTDGTSGIIETVKTLASKLLGAVQDIDWSTIFAGGVSVALLAMVKELTDAFDALSAPAKGLGETLSGVGSVLSGFGKILSKSAGSINKVIKNAAKVVKAFANVLNSYSFSMKAEGIRDIAIALGILVAAVVVLTQLDMEKLQNAVLIVTELAAVLAVLALAMSAIGGSSTSIGASGIQIESSVPKLLGIAASLLVLAGVVKIMGSMSPEEMEQGFIGLAGAVAALVAVVAAYGLLVKADASGNINKAGTMMLAMSVSLLLMIAVVKIAGGLSTEEIEKGIVFMAAFAVFFAAVMAITNIGSDQKVAKVGTLMLSLSASLLILVAVAKLAGGLTVEEIEKGLVFMTAFIVFLAAVVAVTKISSDQQIAKVGTMMLSLSASLLLLVAASKLAGSLSVEEIEKGVAFMAVFTVFLAAVVSITKIGTEEQLAKVGLTMLALSASIGILAGVAVLLGLIKTENLIKGVTAVGVLGTIMALMMNFSKYTTSNTASVIALAASIAVLAVAAAALSLIDTTKLAGASVALSALMGMFALILKASSTVTSSLSTLIVMVAAVALLAVVLVAVASLPIDASLSASLSLSAMMLAFAAAMKIISSAHSMSASALVAVGVMALVLVELAVILYMLQDLPVDSTIAVAASLSVLLLSLSAACLILSAVGATGAAAYVGVGALLTLVTALGVLMAGIGALCTYFPQLEEFMNKGLSILETIGYGLGSFFGNIVGGFLAGVTDGLPEIGDNLAAFMENAEPFFTGIQNVNADALSGVKALAETILILTKADILNGLTSWFTGGSSIVSFGEELAEFGPYFNEYYQSIKDVDSDVVEGSANAAKTLAEFASELPNQGGVVSWFTGENSLTAFAEELVVFGPLLKQYADSVEGLNAEVVEDSANAAKSIAEMASELPNQGGVVGWFTGENSLSTFAEELVVFGPLLKQYADSVDGLDAEVVENSVSAAEALSGMAENLPNQGGVVSWFTGDNSLSVFGKELAKFGPYLADYADSVDGVDADVVTASANAAATLAAFADGLPNSGGLVSLFTGDNGIAKFGEKLVSFGESFAQYYQSVSGVNVSTLSSVTDEFGKLVDLVSGMSGLDTSVMSGFSQGLISLGNTSIDGFVQTFTNANSRVTEAANSLMTAFIAGINAQKTNVTQTFTSLIQSVLTTLQSSVSQFQTVGSQMMTSFITGIKSQDNTARSTITTIITGCLTILKNKYSEFKSVGSQTMTNFIAGVKAQDSSTRSSYSNIISACLTVIKNKYSEFQSVGSQTMTNFIAGVKAQNSSATSAYSNIISSCLTILNNKYSEFQSAGQQSMSYFANGISAGSSSATAAAASAASAAASSLNSYYSSFYSAGAYLVQGFANGISANTYLAQAQASAMASAAAASANAALGIHSPSKVGQQIGDYFGQGFINGIAGTVDSVYSASAEMANSASSGLTNAISKIAETIDNGIDTEPTIRPVLDLSNVEEGVSTIGALFSRSQALAVSATMSNTSGAEIQNGDSSKIASGGNTFQFYQTNNSPKALSRTEIYRQTKNQFSALERRMNA